MAGGGLNDQGKPAGLVGPDPHESPPPLQPGEKPSAGFSGAMAELAIVVNPAGGRVTIVQPTGEPEVGRRRGLHALRGVGGTAAGRVRGGRPPNRMDAATFEDWYPTKRNPTTHDRWERDAEALAQHLVDRAPAPPPGADRDRLRRFAKYVGVDFPAS